MKEEPLLKRSNLSTLLEDEKYLQEGLDPSTAHILTTKIGYSQNYTDNLVDNKLCYRILDSETDHQNQQETYKKEHQLQMAPGGSLDLPKTSCEIQLTSFDEGHLETDGGIAAHIATLEEIQVPVFIHAKSPIFNDNNPLSHCRNTNGSFSEANTAELLNFDFEVTSKHNEPMRSNNYNTFYNNGGDSTGVDSDSANHNFNTNKNKFIEWEKTKAIAASPVDFGRRTSLELDTADVVFTEEAINISDLNNDNYSFSDVFCFSQNDSILIEQTDDDDTFSQKLSEAEPVIIPSIDHDEEYRLCIQQHQTPEYIKYEMDTMTKTFAEELSPIEFRSMNTVAKRKRNGSHNLVNKRRRLHLNTSTKLSASSIPLTTPDVVNLIADWGKTQDLQCQPVFGDCTTTEDIIKDLLDVLTDSSLPVTANTVCSTASTLTENINSIKIFDPTNSNSSDSFMSSIDVLTPTYIFNYNTIDTAASTYSSSSTNTTDNATDSPQNVSLINSKPKNGDCSIAAEPRLAAVSTAETTTLRGPTKKRGRPSKEHSDMPDPARMKQLSDVERKRAEDRAKNNEASRLSRLKNKLKEEAEIKEAKLLSKRNTAMKLELDNLNKVLIKLKRALQQRHFKKH